ncbi:hypothetical protein BDV98DRAFT_596131 [Pterulicium gracile]|uniref:Uncharacterized protein n=1 Tax=Pterulicium gracile TaxID=1884261 RepID=A0A5C3Q977_9AGAR|nr:hypothetical protein BDV98DRAFT_596131 [Pterula gracilis]
MSSSIFPTISESESQAVISSVHSSVHDDLEWMDLMRPHFDSDTPALPFNDFFDELGDAGIKDVAVDSDGDLLWAAASWDVDTDSSAGLGTPDTDSHSLNAISVTDLDADSKTDYDELDEFPALPLSTAPADFLSPMSHDFSGFDITEDSLLFPLEAATGLVFHKSSTFFLDEDVWSEVSLQPNGYAVTTQCKVNAIERVQGLPSQFPVLKRPTAYVIELNESFEVDEYHKRCGTLMTVDAIIKNQTGTPGDRARGGATIPGELFG